MQRKPRVRREPITNFGASISRGGRMLEFGGFLLYSKRSYGDEGEPVKRGKSSSYMLLRNNFLFMQ